MARSDDDSWDLASSVGATATMVAAARALATKEPDPLINDPFAEPLVKAVGVDFFIRLVDGDIAVSESGDDPEASVQRLIHMLAVRTRFFDDFFTHAGNAGVRQAVILASGLDARPYRLRWPPGTVVYEVDLPDVIEFKTTTLAGLGARPAAEHRTVGVDLRNDWPTALRRSGFDDAAPAAWSAEGLLLYLPPAAQDRLFDNITDLSATASRLATEYHPDVRALLDSRTKALTSRWGQLGFDLDMSELFYAGDRNRVMDYLTARGWEVSTKTRAELFAAAGLALPESEAAAPLRNVIAVTGILESRSDDDADR